MMPLSFDKYYSSFFAYRCISSPFCGWRTTKNMIRREGFHSGSIPYRSLLVVVYKYMDGSDEAVRDDGIPLPRVWRKETRKDAFCLCRAKLSVIHSVVVWVESLPSWLHSSYPAMVQNYSNGDECIVHMSVKAPSRMACRAVDGWDSYHSVDSHGFTSAQW